MDETTETWSELNLYMLRVDEPREALRRPEELIPAPLRHDAGIDGELYFLPPPVDETPLWVQPLRTLTDEVPPLRSSSPGAVLVFRSNDQLFAAAWGRGWTRVRADAIVEDFGLRVAGNWLEPEGVISLDSRAVEQTVFNTRRQASRGTGVGALGFEADRESVHSLTGRPRDASHGRLITGRTGAHLTRVISPAELEAVAAELAAAYGASDYRASFPALDRRVAIRDPRLVGELDQLLIAGLNNPDRGGSYLAPPEVIDWGNLAGFRFSGEPRGTRRPDVSFEDYAALLGGSTITIDRLREDRLHALARDSGRSIPWPVYRALIAERETDEGVFVLSDGRWWRIQPGLVEQINTIVGSLAQSTVELPPYLSTYADEGQYNREAAQRVGGMSIDAALASINGERGRVELADIAGPGKRLIHVKRGLRAEKLSHLFAQAVGSGEALRHLPEARRHLRSLLERDLAEVARSIEDDSIDPASWEIVIAIVAPTARVPKTLPFFSRAHLARAVRTLQRLDYNVTYRAIEPRAVGT